VHLQAGRRDRLSGRASTTTDDIPVVPLLVPSRTLRPNEVFFETRNYRPQVHFQFRRNRPGHYEFRLTLDRGLSRAVPALCTGAHETSIARSRRTRRAARAFLQRTEAPGSLALSAR
jgi:hypothetical protein